MHTSKATFNDRRDDLVLSISLALVIGVLSMIAFYSQIFVPLKTDLHDQLLFVQEMSHRWQWDLYSLFYLLTYLLSFDTGNFFAISCAAMALLTLSVMAKGLLSYLVLKNASG